MIKSFFHSIPRQIFWPYFVCHLLKCLHKIQEVDEVRWGTHSNNILIFNLDSVAKEKQKSSNSNILTFQTENKNLYFESYAINENLIWVFFASKTVNPTRQTCKVISQKEVTKEGAENFVKVNALAVEISTKSQLDNRWKEKKQHFRLKIFEK